MIMKKDDELKKICKSKRFPLIFATVNAFFTVFAAAVSTFAWFQATSNVNIETTSTSATITVTKPDDAKFYYFKGNGNPADVTSYVGYSKSGATMGTSTNVVNTSAGTIQTAEISTPATINFASHFQEITEEGNFTAAKCFDFRYIRPGCYYTYAVSYKTSAAMTLKIGQFTQVVQGSGLTPRRYLGSNGTTSLSLAQALNSTSYPHTYSNASALNTASVDYVKKTLGVGSLSIASDGIDYDGATPASTTKDFTIASKSAGSDATYYIFFTVYMESDKTNALSYSATNSDNTKRYYVTDSSNGNYVPYDGLSVMVNSISLT